MDEMLKGLRIGAGIAIVAVIVWLAYMAYDTRQKALRGDAAAAFIERVNAPAPPAATPPSSAPAEPKK